jgi:hypothetical protein
VASQAFGLLTRRLLRVGIVLLGFSVSFGSIAALGMSTVAMVACTLVATLVVTTWLGNRVGLGRPRSLLVATGFAICGASAIAAMEGRRAPRKTSRSGGHGHPLRVTGDGPAAAAVAPAACSSASGRAPASRKSVRSSRRQAQVVRRSSASPSWSS